MDFYNYNCEWKYAINYMFYKRGGGKNMSVISIFLSSQNNKGKKKYTSRRAKFQTNYFEKFK